MKKKILILTAGFGEGHNSAARGVRDGLARVASDQTTVELQDLFAEAYGPTNELVRRSYLALVNSAPRAWGFVYRWLDRKTDYNTEFRRLTRLKAQFGPVLDRFKPDIVVCSFPAYANVLQDILGAKRVCKCVVVVTDSITINASWYRSPADYFLVANEQSARRAAERRRRAGQNQGLWISCQSQVCRFRRRSAIAFHQFQPAGFVHDQCRQARRGRTRAYARET